MNINSFLRDTKLLPVTVKKRENELRYYFEQDVEGYVLDFLLSEMPGVVLISDDEYLISVSIEDRGIITYKGEYYSEFSEKLDNDFSIGLIKEIFTSPNEIEFYNRIKTYPHELRTEDIRSLGLKTPEEIFFQFFLEAGYKKSRISESMNYDGYNEVAIHFESKSGEKLEVYYPEYDYVEDMSYFFLDNNNDFNWIDFFKDVEKKGVLSYKGISRIY